ncbi:putative MIF4G-like domain superfamily protein [Helianthus debilis subsp. tardiflorus]
MLSYEPTLLNIKVLMFTHFVVKYAAVFAALVSGLACLVGIDFGAKLLASLAHDEYRKEDNLSLRNLTLLLSYIYIYIYI